MRSVSKSMLAVVAASALAVAGAACDNTREGARQDANEAQREAGQAGREAGAATREAGRDAAEATREAGREAGEAARGAGEATRDAGRGAAEATREAGREAGQPTREAGREVGGAAGRSGSAIGAATETMDVKAALMGDSTVDASDINVDTYADRRTVVLRGSVRTQAQKAAAAKIAAREAEGYKVDNQLTVRPAK